MAGDPSPPARRMLITQAKSCRICRPPHLRPIPAACQGANDPGRRHSVQAPVDLGGPWMHTAPLPAVGVAMPLALLLALALAAPAARPWAASAHR